MTPLGTLPTLDANAVSKALAASTSIRTSAQALRQEIAGGRSGEVRKLLSNGSPRRIDGFARQSLNKALSRLPRVPALDSLNATAPVLDIKNTASRADMARSLIACGSLQAADVPAFCSGSMTPLTALADEAVEGFRLEVARLAASVPDLLTFQGMGKGMLALGSSSNENIVGYDRLYEEFDQPFALLVPEALYGIIRSDWYLRSDGSFDREALRALLLVANLVTPMPYLSPTDLLDGVIGEGISPMMEETLDALIIGKEQFGLDGFFDLLEKSDGSVNDLPPEMEPAYYMELDDLRELAELYFKTTESAAFVRELMDTGPITAELARNAVEQSPPGLRDRLLAILELRESVNRLAPAPKDAGVPGACGGFCGAFLYPGILEEFVNSAIHSPLMEGGERSFIAIAEDVPGCLRYHALQILLFEAFLHLVADLG